GSVLNITVQALISLVIPGHNPARTFVVEGYAAVCTVKIPQYIGEHPAEHVIHSSCSGCLCNHPVDNGELLVPCLGLLLLDLPCRDVDHGQDHRLAGETGSRDQNRYGRAVRQGYHALELMDRA